MPVAKAAFLTLLLSSSAAFAFQPQTLPSSSSLSSTRHQRTQTATTHLNAKKKPKSKSGGGGGFGSKSASASIDSAKVRSVSGYTGSGTKVLADAANNFDRIRKLFGVAATTDVYVRSPLNDETVFWYVGKVIRMIDAKANEVDDDVDGTMRGTVYPTEAEAILSQKRLILEYAKNQLRPQNMGGPYSKALELWSAPGDSEMDVVQNKVTLVRIAGSSRDLSEGFNVNDVGLNPEIYVGDEKKKGGLRVVRDTEGRPVNPVFEINV